MIKTGSKDPSVALKELPAKHKIKLIDNKNKLR